VGGGIVAHRYDSNLRGVSGKSLLHDAEYRRPHGSVLNARNHDDLTANVDHADIDRVAADDRHDNGREGDLEGVLTQLGPSIPR
jgi:hypothetical protein